MAANTSIDLISLDFNTIKNSLKEYLRDNSQFQDYDFEGSNMALLLELLAYNTHKNAFYYNMAISEAFLDSAQSYASVVSHAKDLNYMPQSRRSAQANVTVTFEATGASAPYLVPKGAPFSTLVKNEAYVFTLPENVFVSSSNNTYTFDATIYEGNFVRDTYTITDISDGVRYRITNKNIDTTSLTVLVYEDGSQVADIYTPTETLLGLTPTSKIFFTQAVGNGYYEILFGDNIFGRRPKMGSTVVIEYRVSEGDAANGARIFSVDFDPTGSDELNGTPEITVNDTAADGSAQQSIESLRTYAPRYFATQQRAVSSDDYASLLLSQFSGTIDDVTVYGGETVEPRLYGRVILAVKPITGEIVPEFVKTEIENYMLDYVSIPTRILLVNPEYFYLEVTTTVQYDSTITTKSKNEIKGLVETTIQTFSDDNLELFDSDFRFSRFVRAIDDTDDSIISNDTSIMLTKRLSPMPDEYFTTTIPFNNAIHNHYAGSSDNASSVDLGVVYSSYFTYIDSDGIQYPLSYMKENGQGTIVIVSLINDTLVVLNPNIGTVDYDKGIVTISKLLCTNYGDYLRIYVHTTAKDIIMNQDKIVLIDSADVTVTVIGKLE